MAQEPVRLRETFQKFWTKDKTESLLSILEAQEWDKNIYFLKIEYICSLYRIIRDNPLLTSSGFYTRNDAFHLILVRSRFPATKNEKIDI